MAAGLEIRKAERRDLPSLLRLYGQLNPDDPELEPAAAEAIFGRFSAGDGNAIFLGVLDGTPVTTVALVVVPNLTRGGAPYALIEKCRHRRRAQAARIRAGDPADGVGGGVAVRLLQGHAADRLKAPGHAFILPEGRFRAEQDGIPGAPARRP